MNTSDQATFFGLMASRTEVRNFQSALDSSAFTTFTVNGDGSGVAMRFIPAPYLNNALNNYVTARLANISSGLTALGVTQND